MDTKTVWGVYTSEKFAINAFYIYKKKFSRKLIQYIIKSNCNYIYSIYKPKFSPKFVPYNISDSRFSRKLTAKFVPYNISDIRPSI